MAIAVIELGEATLKTNWERIDFSVSLPDLKQPIITANVCIGMILLSIKAKRLTFIMIFLIN